MIKKVFLIFMMCFLFFSCKNEEDKKTTTKTSSTLKKTEPVKRDISKPLEKENLPKDSIIESKDFYVGTIHKESDDIFDSEAILNLYNEKDIAIASFEVNTEFMEKDIKVFEINHHNLYNVKRIITFEIADCPCACTFTLVYVLETKNNSYFKLPPVIYSAEEYRQQNLTILLERKTPYTIH